MSSPSFSNIDRWLFEWNEGNLSSEQIEQLKLFLLLHPELEFDKDSWENARVSSDFIAYPHSEKLKRKQRIAPFFLTSSVALLFIVALSTTYWMSSPSKLAYKRGAMRKERVSGQTKNLGNSLQELAIVQSKKSSEKVRNQHIETQSQEFNKIHSDQENSNAARMSKGVDQITSFIEVVDSVDFRNELEKYSNSNGESEVVLNQSADLNLIGSIDSDKMLYNEMEIKNNEEYKFVIDSSSTNDLVLANGQSSELTHHKLNGHVKRTDISLAMRWRKISRSVKRMMDNPVALKNVKDPIYLVPGMSPMDVNFGAAGKLLATRFQASSRAQWLSQEQQQMISQIAVDGYSYGMRGGLGIQLNHRYLGNGLYQDANAKIIYSPKISITREVTIEPSIRFTMGNKSINSNKLTPGMNLEVDRSKVVQFQSGMPLGNSLWYRDLGAGLLINTKWFYIGGQIDNVMRHQDNMFDSNPNDVSRSSYHTVISAGTEYESIRKTSSISPYIVYQKEGDFEETWFGAQFRYHWLTAGISLSDQFEPAASIGIKFKQFMLVYGADYLQSAQMNNRSISHQLTIRFTTKPSRLAQRLLNQ